jgi:hypothetical protein
MKRTTLIKRTIGYILLAVSFPIFMGFVFQKAAAGSFLAGFTTTLLFLGVFAIIIAFILLIAWLLK